MFVKLTNSNSFPIRSLIFSILFFIEFLSLSILLMFLCVFNDFNKDKILAIVPFI